MDTVTEIDFGEVYVNRIGPESLQGFHAGYRQSGIGGDDGEYGLGSVSPKKDGLCQLRASPGGRDNALWQGSDRMKLIQSLAARTLVSKIFEAIGSLPEEAKIIADHLVESNLVGHESHGLIRVKKYVDWCRNGDVHPNRHAEIASDHGMAFSHRRAIRLRAGDRAGSHGPPSIAGSGEWFRRSADP